MRKLDPIGIRFCRRSSSSNAARLGRDRRRLRLHRVPVPGGEPWRPPVADPARPRQRADLSAVARDLLHFLDVLRLGRLCEPHQRRLPRDLYRPDPDDRAVRAAVPPGDPACEIAAHHLDRRLHRRALRQEPGGGGNGGADRDHRIGSLYRAPAQGGGLVVRDHLERRPGDRPYSDHRRHRTDGDACDGDLRRAVRHPPDRRDRTPARADARGRHRIDRETGGLSRRRRLRHVLDVRSA